MPQSDIVNLVTLVYTVNICFYLVLLYFLGRLKATIKIVFKKIETFYQKSDFINFNFFLKTTYVKNFFNKNTVVLEKQD